MSIILLIYFNFLRLPQYNNLLKGRYHKVETMPKTHFFGKGGLESCISRFIQPSKPIMENDPNHPKTHKLENLVLIAEYEKKIREIAM